MTGEDSHLDETSDQLQALTTADVEQTEYKVDDNSAVDNLDVLDSDNQTQVITLPRKECKILR